MSEESRDRQLAEAESLEAIFGEEFCASGSWREDDSSEISFVVSLCDSAGIHFWLPLDYPDTSRPKTELTWNGAGDAHVFRHNLSQYVETLPLGDEMAFAIVSWCQEQLSEGTALGQSADGESAVAMPATSSVEGVLQQSGSADEISTGHLPLSSYFRAEALGEGGFGSVMHVYDEDGREWAAKQFERAEDGGVDTTTLREIGLLRALRSAGQMHPNIVAISDMAEINGELCMIMASYRCSLRDALQGGALAATKGSQVRIASGLLSAVAFLHSCRTMHRDIKPGNVMLTDGLDPVLIDFSLAKVDLGSTHAEEKTPRKGRAKKQKKKRKALVKQEGGEEVRHSQGVGTPLYMAPEVIGSAEYSDLADMWSLGIVLLEVFDADFCAKLDQCEKEKIALALVKETVARLGTKPIPSILRGTLEVDPSARLSARAALDRLREAMPKTSAGVNEVADLPPVQLSSMPVDESGAGALPEAVLSKIRSWTALFRCSDRVRSYAAMYAARSELVRGQPLHGVVLAARFLESDPEAAPLYDLEELAEWLEDEEVELEEEEDSEELELGLGEYLEVEQRLLRELDYVLY